MSTSSVRCGAATPMDPYDFELDESAESSGELQQHLAGLAGG